MNDAAPAGSPPPHTRDILAELEAEVAGELEDDVHPRVARLTKSRVPWSVSRSASLVRCSRRIRSRLTE